MSTETRYSINLDARYNPLELVDVQAIAEACQERWYNQTLCRVKR
ncbi:MAG TPA: hypothetical protein VJV74_01110 [Terriglobia bacterium]|nr:hypothetical protein [Terriglobia bacterium]